MPILPGLNDFDAEFDRLAESARRANASYIRWNTLFLTSCSKSCYLPFLRNEFPALSRLNEDFFRDGIRPPKGYCDDVDARMTDAVVRNGFQSDGSALREVNETDHLHAKRSGAPFQPDIFGSEVRSLTP